MKNDQAVLGIDIGTTKVAAVIIDGHRQLLGVSLKPHKADRRSQPGYAEQDAKAILDAVRSAVCDLPLDLRKSAVAVGLTGQMHGVTVLDKNLKPITPLITWQDARCLQGRFLSDLHAETGYHLRSGFGCATLAWLGTNHLMPASAFSASTIHDLLAAKLCALDKPVTDPTDAASWGLFDLQTLNWDIKALEAAGLSAELLPKVVPCSSQAGVVCKTMADEFGISQELPVTVAIGDNQASLLATLKEPEHELALTLGTGGQLSAVLSAGHKIKPLEPGVKYEYRPFTDSRFLVTAASLCGGTAWSWLAQAMEKCCRDLDITVPAREQLYERLNDLGLKAAAELEVRPHFLGERYDTSLRGTIGGIDSGNFDLGTLARGLARGIIENLENMFPDFALQQRNSIVGSGNALRHNRLLQVATEQVFDLPLTVSDLQEEAACGAAINASYSL